MKNKHLKVDSEDLEDVFDEIAAILDMKFEPGELRGVKTFGDLCDAILSKIDLPEKDDCTSQQGFYKLRESINKTTGIEKSRIKPDIFIKELFTENQIIDIENNLGFKLNILRVKKSVIGVTVLLLSISVVWMFVNILFGAGFAVTILLLYFLIGTRIKELKVNTIGEVVEIMKRENYFHSRRDMTSMNRKEIIDIVEKHLIDNLATDLKKLDRETVIV